MEASDQLPEGWECRQVGDVILDAQAGFSSGQKDVPGGIPHLRMNNITSGCTLDLSEVRTVPRELAKARHYLRPDDVLVCHTNSVKLVGKCALYDMSDAERAFSNHLTRLRVNPDVIHPQWVWRGLAVLWRDRYFETRCKKWVNQATIERDVLLAAPIALPPLPEQQRLVEKIGRLLEQSRTAREALDRIPPLLKRFRQAVLAKAFRGELTERDPNDEPASVLLERIREERRQSWEEDLRARGKDPRKAKYVEPEPPDTSGLPGLPERWVWAALGELVDIGGGSQPSKKHFTYEEAPGYTRLLQIRDFGQRPVPTFIPTRLARKTCRKEDVLVARYGASLGRIVTGMEGAYNVALAKVILDERMVTSRFVYRLLQSEYFQAPIHALSRSAQNGFNRRDIYPLPVPLPPLPVQRRIVTRVDALLTQAEAIEQAVMRARRRAERVDQAVLARAFRGEL